ncbi:MAG: translation initiation factor IF-2 [Candidatus Pacebacteria bacterium]|nr:translation initiation factor IF-2 [Candidatus Paceibacterota bacterium]MBP9781007.1 translation initiation factor IF-2 [Candidatus Paceibacterota bacterium]
MNTKGVTVRPPVVVIMGHIDHGKSTLLDYIRKSNIVDKEAGGITQHLSAYEVIHKDEKGESRKITFLDTPGHAAFSGMRERGATVADIAILIVSAEDGVKAQTIEALNTIVEAKVPYLVAINKIDRPGANVEKAKMELMEKGVYLEGYGGNIPYVEISAKAGTNIPALLDTILLVADMENFTGDMSKTARGIVIESNMDPKRGISATMVIKDGTLSKGMFLVVEDAIVATRIMEDFLGKTISEVSMCAPVRLIGFDKVPAVGSVFESFNSKKEAESAVALYKEILRTGTSTVKKELLSPDTKVIPIVIKTDVVGTGEAIEKEILKMNTSEISFKILSRGVGSIGENDLKAVSGDKEALIVGFNVKIDSKAENLNESLQIPVHTYTIIYKLTEMLAELIEERRPRKQVMEVVGKTKVLKTFSATKERRVIGGRVESGKLAQGHKVRIMRRDFEIGEGVIIGVEQGKIKSKEVLEGNECGILVEAKNEIAPGDYLESFVMTTK